MMNPTVAFAASELVSNARTCLPQGFAADVKTKSFNYVDYTPVVDSEQDITLFREITEGNISSFCEVKAVKK